MSQSENVITAKKAHLKIALKNNKAVINRQSNDSIEHEGN